MVRKKKVRSCELCWRDAKWNLRHGLRCELHKNDIPEIETSVQVKLNWRLFEMCDQKGIPAGSFVTKLLGEKQVR
jgi:hypothetical protein